MLLLTVGLGFLALMLLADLVYPVAWQVGYAVCHQLPSHSFFAATRQLPLCARCTGQYLGAFAAALYFGLRGRETAGRWPALRVLAVLGLGTAAWLVDGANSFAATFGLPHLYTPRQALRLLTGLAAGITWMSLFWPLGVQALAARPRPMAVLTARDLPFLVGIAAILAALVYFGSATLRLTLGLVSALSAWGFLTLVMAAGLRLAGGRRLSPAVSLLLGAVAASGLIWAIGVARASLFAPMGLDAAG